MNKKIITGIFATVLLLIIYRAGCLIIAPGLPARMLYQFFNYEHFGSLNTIYRFTLFGSGITQYLGSASLVLISALFSKKIRGLLMGGTNQLAKLEKIILIFTFLLLVIAAFGINMYLKSIRFSNDMEWEYSEDILSQALFITSRICGGFVVIFIARTITRIGIINGIAAMLLLNMFYDIKSGFTAYFINSRDLPDIERFDLFMGVAFIILLIILSIIIITGKRELRAFRTDMPNGNDAPFIVPVRVNVTGTVPPEIAGSLIALVLYQVPAFFGGSFAVPIYIEQITLVALSIVLTIIFAYMSFNPISISATLQRFGYALEPMDDGTTDIEHLQDVYRPMVGLSSMIAAIIALTPLAMSHILGPQKHPLAELSGFNIIILICVILDCKYRLFTLKKIDSAMTAIGSFNTYLESDLFLDRLKKMDINGISINNRVLPVTGTLSYWELCAPKIPYFIMHRNIAGGRVTVYVRAEDMEKATVLLETCRDKDDARAGTEAGHETDQGCDLKQVDGGIQDRLDGDVDLKGDKSDAEKLLSKVERLTRKLGKKRK